MHQIGAVRPGAVCPRAPDELPVAATEEKDDYTTIISQLEEADLQEGGVEPFGNFQRLEHQSSLSAVVPISSTDFFSSGDHFHLSQANSQKEQLFALGGSSVRNMLLP